MAGPGPRPAGRLAPATGTARVFFALWPPAALQRDLGAVAADLGSECGGRAIASGNIHLTLIFVGNVGRERVEALKSAASRVAAEPFELAIDRVDWWRHNRIVWAGVTRMPDALATLVERLGDELRRCGTAVESRPYVPHVTLVRNARSGPAENRIAVRAWPVAQFALVESRAARGGPVYQPIARWPVGRPAARGI